MKKMEVDDNENDNDKNLYKSVLLFMNLTSHKGDTATEVVVENKSENYALNEESKNNSSDKTVANDLWKFRRSSRTLK